MWFSLVLFVVAALLVVLLFILQPSFQCRGCTVPLPFYAPPLLMVLLLLVTQQMSPATFRDGIVGDDEVCPLCIIAIFMCLSHLCLAIDVTGFFRWLSTGVLRAAGSDLGRLFVYNYVLVIGLVILTDNDVVILTLTPILLYFTSAGNIPPWPLLYGQFFGANIGGAARMVGNPATIIVAEAMGLTFMTYLKWMALPTFTAAIIAGLTLRYVVFRNTITNCGDDNSASNPLLFSDVNRTTPNNKIDLDDGSDPEAPALDTPMAVLYVVILITCMITLAVAEETGLATWEVIVVSDGIAIGITLVWSVLGTCTNITRHRWAFLLRSIQVMPWDVIPFVLGMFVLVEQLREVGWVDEWATLLADAITSVAPGGGVTFPIFVVGIVAWGLTNIICNQPTAILMSRICLSPSFAVPETTRFGALLAVVVATNFGANFTLIGALAGIMWSKILTRNGVPLSPITFSRMGFITNTVPIVVAWALLAIEMTHW